MSEQNKLPSAKQPGDNCIVRFGLGCIADNAHVTKVHFATGGKIMYDIEALLQNLDYPAMNRARFYNVDSMFVE